MRKVIFHKACDCFLLEANARKELPHQGQEDFSSLSSTLVLASFLLRSCLDLATFHSRSSHTVGILMSKLRVWLEAAWSMARSSLEYAKGTDTLHLRYAIRAIVLRYRVTKGTLKEHLRRT